MRRSMIDGGAFSVMMGLGEFYLPAFVLALALGEVASGLVATVPQIAGALLQLAGFSGVRWLKSHKRWVLVAVAVQSLAFVPLAVGAAAGSLPAWAVFAAATMYWAGGMAGGAAWSTWVGTMVPQRCRSRFFSRRQRVLQSGTLLGFLGAGVSLWVVSGGVPLEKITDDGSRRLVLWTFAGLFACAGVCRAVSWLFLLLQSEPSPMPAGHRAVGVRELWGRVRAPITSPAGQDAKLILYMLGVNFSAHFAAPFVNPYVLKELGHNYLTYTWLIGTVPLAKAVALGLMGLLAARFGARRLLLIGGLGIVPVSALWAVSTSLAWLGVLQVCSGFAWAAWELATFLLILERLKPQERTSLMATYYVGNSACIAAGSALGGWLLASLGAGQTAYAWVFGLSTLMRALTIVPLVWIVRWRVSDPHTLAAGAPPIDGEAWPGRSAPTE
ncbi:MAG: MFS transporter [Phycisphaerales bacterium]